MKHFISHSPKETEQIAEAMARKLRPGDVIAFEGGLGAGKTAFTRGLVRGLQIPADVSSPTFALVNEYRGEERTLYHFDMYRVESFEDLYSTGFFDYLDGESILAIEWSENIFGALPDGVITVQIEPKGEDCREITIKGDDRF
ncbi:tRNA (adenosine(37)-N6)-threonylcarbamoyltransferase complex ATPase subunit type 1 TsaE [Zongyangia hominis]|uniref:tRNA threonylcarbamoyladenosine biosynthesis protein TsaE n=1 Tax=Zongyangia hominis TaxID=2763677 RepID=A0A926IBY4_9FIRM|nr:tRNA (adenosine(37)-N6)-threonylcarbamoyltransferase complex ATPase subunit type 1 TsaE [Zongyangia hominis]MBC8570768.1 tRNA (adenosine(37)-N6)-threonylcarbamoyltransferase complex ATPase subunit type 1 TsaE [Zongyangia hominis]